MLQGPQEHLAILGPEELEETHRAHGPERDPSDREGKPLALQTDFQERSRGDHVEVREVLVEETQPFDRLGTFLDLVEKEQRPFGQTTNVVPCLQGHEEISRSITGPDHGQVMETLQVDLEKEVEILTEVPYRRRFPRLASPSEHQRLGRTTPAPRNEAHHRL